MMKLVSPSSLVFYELNWASADGTTKGEFRKNKNTTNYILQITIKYKLIN